jgi:hypothetical protein
MAGRDLGERVDTLEIEGCCGALFVTSQASSRPTCVCATRKVDGVAEVRGIHAPRRARELREHMVHTVEQIFETSATGATRQEESSRLVDLALDLKELIDESTSSMVCKRYQLGCCAHE